MENVDLRYLGRKVEEMLDERARWQLLMRDFANHVENSSTAISNLGRRIHEIRTDVELTVRAEVVIRAQRLEEAFGQRLAILERHIDGRFEEVEARLTKMVETRLGEVETRLTNVEGQLGKMNGRLDRLESRFDHLESRFDRLESLIKRLLPPGDHAVSRPCEERL